MEKLKKLKPWHLFVIIALFFLLLELGGLVFELKYKDKFYPGVIIAGETVGGKTYSEVVEYFKSRAEVLATDGLIVALSAQQGNKKIVIPATQTGLTSDNVVQYFAFGEMQTVIDEAYAWGRTGSAWQKFKERFSLIPTKRFVFPVTVYSEAIESLLDREFEGFLVKAIPARFEQGANGIIVNQEQIGEVVDIAAAVDTIGQRLIDLKINQVDLIAKVDAPIATAERLNNFKNLADDLTRSTTLVFRYNGYKWQVAGPILATWLTIKSAGEIGIEPSKLEIFLNKTVVPVIDNPPQNSRFEMRKGELVEIAPGHAGKTVDVQKTIENVEEIVYSVQKSFAQSGNMAAAVAEASASSEAVKVGVIIEVPVVIIDADPRVTKETIDQYKIKDLLGKARTSFAGSSNDRKQNIKIGASKLNGLLIAPGEEFSVVGGIGYVTEEEGYAKEYVIKEGQSIKELGGGLCQIATTMFRAVLNAGLPVTERQNHRYVVGYYGPGLDATIYGPHPDLRFVNDTGSYVLLQGFIEGNEVVFEFYGQKDGRVATVSEPEITDRIDPPLPKLIPTYDLGPGITHCTEQARQGLTANALYSIVYSDGRVREQNFKSVYVPWQKVCLMGVAR